MSSMLDSYRENKLDDYFMLESFAYSDSSFSVRSSKRLGRESYDSVGSSTPVIGNPGGKSLTESWKMLA